MRYYIAGRYDRREELCGYADELRALGHTVDCRWLLGLHQVHQNAEKIDVESHPEHGITLDARPFAQDDYEDVKASEAIILFSEPPEAYSKRGGRHVEFGMALAWGKCLIVIGRRENVFHCLPQVERYDSWEVFKALLIQHVDIESTLKAQAELTESDTLKEVGDEMMKMSTLQEFHALRVRLIQGKLEEK